MTPLGFCYSGKRGKIKDMGYLIAFWIVVIFVGLIINGRDKPNDTKN